MKALTQSGGALFVALLASSLFTLTTWSAELITNGSFESGFTGWSRADQTGSDGTFFSQTGTLSPVQGSPVPAPPQGSFAAMTDAGAPGTHVLYQDFFVTNSSAFALNFSLFVGNSGPDFYTPGTLDFSTTAINQRARVDLMSASSSPFSLLSGDILVNLFETAPGSPLSFGYTNYSYDLTSLLQPYQGTTIRLRFAEVDNLAPLNLGVDKVSLTTSVTNVPDPLSWYTAWLALIGLLIVARLRQRPRPACPA